MQATRYLTYYFRGESHGAGISLLTLVFCREGTFFLIVNHLGEEKDYILSQLRSNPESLFLYLKTLIEVHSTGTLNFSSLRKDNASDFRGSKKLMSSEVYLESLSDLPKLLQNYPIHITDEMTELYIEVSIVLN